MMKTFFTILFLIFTLQTSFAQTVSSESEIEDVENYTGIINEQFPNGKPSLWKNLVNGKADGLWMEWLPNGNLRYRAYWRDGKGHGKWKYFHPNGSIRYAGVYDNDQPVGIHQGFYANGTLQYEIVYVDGKRHGISLDYTENGILEKSQLYLDGKIVLDKPILFAEGIIATKENQEWGITFTPDGNTAYFCRREAGKQAQKIYESELNEGKWSKPTIAKFSTNTDESPFITKDGKGYISLLTELCLPPKKRLKVI